MLNMKWQNLIFFDEKFAPFELDDIDLCCRAFEKLFITGSQSYFLYRA